MTGFVGFAMTTPSGSDCYLRIPADTDRRKGDIADRRLYVASERNPDFRALACWQAPWL
jgi:hypothetical protein